MITQNPVPTPLAILKKTFHFSSFRNGQKEIIESVLAGRDTLGVMPTGSGKSLCYQIPALILPGITLIISPLIALMKDQVDNLQQLGVPATFLNSTLNVEENERRLWDLRQNKYKLLYVAPERFRVVSFMKLINQLQVSLLAVDEAHCISQWGHDFRPSYLRIKEIVKKIGRPPVVALTATATKEVRLDIVHQLGLKNCNVVVKGFDRPNLKFFAVELPDEKSRQRELLRIISSLSGTGIIYVATQKAVAAVSEWLYKHKFEVVGYHGGMDKKQRTAAQNAWLSGRASVIVATNAFGMGIDKADVRYVIHYNLPGSMEAYYQEAGRSGRDGKTSYCVLFFTYRDHITQEYLITNNFPSEQVLQAIYEFLFGLDQTKILYTYRQIAESVESNEMQVAAAVKLFERYHILKRMNRQEHTYEVYLLKDANKALKSMQRESISKKLLLYFNKSTVFVFSLEETLRTLQISKEQFANGIRQLVKKDILHYTPPFRGRGIILTAHYVDWSKLNIDFEEYNRRRQFALDRLVEMERYVTQKGCRRKYLLKYFGEVYRKKNCGACDVCLKWHSPEAEDRHPAHSDDIQAVLDCVRQFDGIFGVTTFAKILKGIMEERFEKWDVDNSSSFGALKKRKKDKIIRLIYTAIGQGYLEKSDGKYPTVEITAKGLGKLDYK